MPAAAAAARLKREDCPRTKHDSLFSPWKVLVGASDWEDHSSGKEGVQRYRIRNLPDNFPGLYELGVAGASDEGVRLQRRDSRGVVVVYLGQADNVRARLQQYGRTGSHLDTGNSAGKDEVDALTAEPGLFREVFARGYSMVFRCALMDNKQVAEKTEAQLLRVFDYAWNKLQNGACRREEILLKLEYRAVSHASSLLSRVHDMKQKIFGEKPGIKIKGSGSIETSSGIMSSMLPRVRTLVRFRPHLVNSDNGGSEAIDVVLNRPYHGHTSGNRQPHGRRSEGYKVKRIDVTKRRTVPIQNSSVCGVVLEDGSSCLEEPVQGRKRCNLHKGRRVKGNPKSSSSSFVCQVEVPNTESVPQLNKNLSKSHHAQENEFMVKKLDATVKGSSTQSSSCEAKVVKTGEPSTEDAAHETSGSGDSGIYGQKSSYAESQSQEQPSGRIWFELIKAQENLVSTHLSGRPECPTRVADDVAPICGATTDNGSFRASRDGCEKLSEMTVTGVSYSRRSGWPCNCGARTSDGSPCMNRPVEGRKRCALHKGQRASCSPIALVA